MRLSIIIAFILSIVSISYADVDLSSDEYVQTMLKRVEEGKAGTYIKWQPLVLTYKDYKGSPDMDSPEFEKIIDEKFENGACRTYYTKYEKTPYNEVKRLADVEKDSEAMFEMYLRLQYKRDFVKEAEVYLESAAKGGNLNAYLEYHRDKGVFAPVDNGEWDIHNNILSAFTNITPSATLNLFWMQGLGRKRDNKRLNQLQAALSYAGNYEKALFHAGTGRDNYTQLQNNITPLDCFCEAYFRGCATFFKNQIKCENSRK